MGPIILALAQVDLCMSSIHSLIAAETTVGTHVGLGSEGRQGALQTFPDEN